ncbi:MAG: D-alanine--D-alanine ligase [Gammaproteobacteria bacterium]|nr:D-alanine--D-alanine ligase [Gammaproteobacteria bacterium]
MANSDLNSNIINSKKVVHALRRVAVLYGGRSEEREVSLLTGNAVANALKRQNCHVDLIDWIGRDSVARLLSENYDCVFIALHGIDGEDGTVQALLEILEIPYTGSSILASALCMDKLRTKQILKANRLPVLEDMKITKNYTKKLLDEILHKLGLPLCIKPVQQGSSKGITKVERAEDLESAIIEALHYDERVMVEPWLSGKEYTVGFLNNQALPSIWIEAKQEFYTYDAKYITKDTLYHCPSDLSDEKEQQIRKMAQQAFEITGCHDWGRVDLITDQKGNFYILEVNTVPGLTDTSLVPKAAKSIGISFDALVLQIMMNASIKQLAKLHGAVSEDKANA